jgi:hypothetical protein
VADLSPVSGGASDAERVAGFQVNWAEEDAGAHMLIVSCFRQLTDEAAGYGAATRSAGFQSIMR